jgi:hypothetical protein
MSLEFHEFANIFPLLGEAELGRLADDIRDNGQQVPITLHEGKILDGRNRYRACVQAGVEPQLATYQGTDPLGFVVTHNLHRRHLTESQRAMIAAKLADLKRGGVAGCHKTNASIDALVSEGKSRDEAAAQMQVGRATIDRAKRIQRTGIPELADHVNAGKVSVNAAYIVSSLPAEEQRELIKQGPEAVKAKSTEIRNASAKLAKPEQPEPAPAPRKVLPCVPDEAEDLWLLARGYLDKIHQQDASRVKILKQVAAYVTDRLERNK